MPEMKSEKGTYALLLHLHKRTCFHRVGPFGEVTLPRGYYLYVGSAFGSGGVRARVGHHARIHKPRLHWHLDYVRPAMRIRQLWATYDPEKRECAWARLVHQELHGGVEVPGFGSADCNKIRRPPRCPSHFFHFLAMPSWEAFCEAVKRVIPGHATIELVKGDIVMGQAAGRIVLSQG